MPWQQQLGEVKVWPTFIHSDHYREVPLYSLWPYPLTAISRWPPYTVTTIERLLVTLSTAWLLISFNTNCYKTCKEPLVYSGEVRAPCVLISMTRTPPVPLGMTFFSPSITPGPGRAWHVTSSAHPDERWSVGDEYCCCTVLPMSANFLHREQVT